MEAGVYLIFPDSSLSSVDMYVSTNNYALQKNEECAPWLKKAREGLYSCRKLAEAANCSFSNIRQIQSGVSDAERACLVYNLNVPIKKQKTRPGSLFKWEAWRILLLQRYE